MDADEGFATEPGILRRQPVQPFCMHSPTKIMYQALMCCFLIVIFLYARQIAIVSAKSARKSLLFRKPG
jgi:hypothetical protein